MSGTGGFQTQVFSQPAIGIAGDFASMNPFSVFDVGAGGLVAGPAGVTIGNFAWVTPPLDPNSGPLLCNSFGAGNVSGFVGRNQQGSNSTYLSNAGMTVLGGYGVFLYTGGDFLCVNSGPGQVLRGNKAYANFATGAVTFAATGSPTTGASATGSSIAASTSSVTGSIAGNVLTVSTVGSGTVYPGTTISGTGVATGTTILSQLSGTAGGIGTYRVSIPLQTVASTTISGTYGTLTVGTVTAGNFAVNDYLNATGSVVAGTQITQLLTGTGGTGTTAVVTNNTVVSSQVISAASNVETPWYALNSGLAGSIIKISAPVGGYGSQLS